MLLSIPLLWFSGDFYEGGGIFEFAAPLTWLFYGYPCRDEGDSWISASLYTERHSCIRFRHCAGTVGAEQVRTITYKRLYNQAVDPWGGRPFVQLTMATTTEPTEKTIDADLFGKHVHFDYSETWVAYSMVGLRLLLAWVFLQAGLSKLLEGGLGAPLAWTAEGFLVHGVSDANPFKFLFEGFAGLLWLVDPMVVFGQILIGLALLFGAFFRFAALCGALQMLFFWLGAFDGGLAAGFPIAHGYVVDYTLVYAILLFGLGAWGAGRILGLDAKLEKLDVVKQNAWLRYLLG